MKLKDLLSQKRVVETEITERQKELQALEILINSQRKREGLPPESGSPLVATSNNGDGERQKRVRGTLKAAKQAVDSLEGAFTRAEFFTKVGEINPALAGKIKPEAQRSTIRKLIEEGFLKPSDEPSEETGEVRYEAAFPLR